MFFIGNSDDDGSKASQETLKVITEKLAEVLKLIGGTFNK